MDKKQSNIGAFMDVNSTFEKTGIKCKVLQEIIQLAKKNCVEKVILFGSGCRTSKETK